MITAIDFVSRKIFQESPVRPEMAAISIFDPDLSPPPRLAEYSRSRQLRILDLEDTALGYAAAELAVRSAIDFIISLAVEPTPYRLVIHCEGGVSRSAAIALIAQHLTGARFPRRPDANYANRMFLGIAEDLLDTILPPPPDTPHDLLPCWLAI